MKDAGDLHNDDLDSDQDSVGRAMTDSDNGIGKADAESRRTSVSNRDELLGESIRGDAAKSTGASATAPTPTSTNAQLIAAQALNLQTPARGGFTAINTAGANGSRPHSARTSPEAPSRAGSVSSTGGGHRRVFKIHARSSTRHPTNQANGSPSVTLPERPADGTISPGGPVSQPQGDVRKPSPASLQNILQDFPAPAIGASRGNSQSPKPAGTRRPLPSAPMRGDSPSRPATLSAVNAKLTQPLRDIRAGSAPVQSPQRRDPVAEEIRRAGSASAVPGSSRHGTPQPPRALAPAPAAAPAQVWEQPPPPMHLPPLPTTVPAVPAVPTVPTIPHVSTTPLATLSASAGNSRANSPSAADTAAAHVSSHSACRWRLTSPSPTPGSACAALHPPLQHPSVAVGG